MISKNLYSSLKLHKEQAQQIVSQQFQPVKTISNAKNDERVNLNLEYECLPSANRYLNSWSRIKKPNGIITNRDRKVKSEYKDPTEPSIDLEIIDSINKNEIKIAPMISKINNKDHSSATQKIYRKIPTKEDEQRQLVQSNSKLISQILQNKIEGKRGHKQTLSQSTISQFTHLRELFGDHETKNKVILDLNQFKSKSKVDKSKLDTSQADKIHLLSFEQQENEQMLQFKTIQQEIKQVNLQLQYDRAEVSKQVAKKTSQIQKISEIHQRYQDNERINIQLQISIQISKTGSKNLTLQSLPIRFTKQFMDTYDSEETTPFQEKIQQVLEQIQREQIINQEMEQKAKNIIYDIDVQLTKVRPQYHEDLHIQYKKNLAIIKNELIMLYRNEIKQYEICSVGKSKSIIYFIKALWRLGEVFEDHMFPSHLAEWQRKFALMLGYLEYEMSSIQNETQLKINCNRQQHQEIREQLCLTFKTFNLNDNNIDHRIEMVNQLKKMIIQRMESDKNSFNIPINQLKDARQKQLYIIFGEHAQNYESHFALQKVFLTKRIPSALLKSFRRVGYQQGWDINKTSDSYQ